MKGKRVAAVFMVDKTPLIIRKVTDAEKIKSLTEWNKKAKQQDKLKKKLARIR